MSCCKSDQRVLTRFRTRNAPQSRAPNGPCLSDSALSRAQALPATAGPQSESIELHQGLHPYQRHARPKRRGVSPKPTLPRVFEIHSRRRPIQKIRKNNVGWRLLFRLESHLRGPTKSSRARQTTTSGPKPIQRRFRNKLASRSSASESGVQTCIYSPALELKGRRGLTCRTPS